MRRTPAKTAEARLLFLQIVARDGKWSEPVTFPEIAAATGMTAAQALDSICAESANEWRREIGEALVERIARLRDETVEETRQWLAANCRHVNAGG